MQAFFAEAEKVIQHLETKSETLKHATQKLLAFFGEDNASASEIVQTLHNFVLSFRKTIQDNQREKEMEEKKKRIEQRRADKLAQKMQHLHDHEQGSATLLKDEKDVKNEHIPSKGSVKFAIDVKEEKEEEHPHKRLPISKSKFKESFYDMKTGTFFKNRRTMKEITPYPIPPPVNFQDINGSPEF